MTKEEMEQHVYNFFFRARPSCCQAVGTTRFFSSCGGILDLRRGSQPSPWVGPGKPNLPLGLRGKAGGGARVTAGPKRPHLSRLLIEILLALYISIAMESQRDG